MSPNTSSSSPPDWDASIDGDDDDRLLSTSDVIEGPVVDELTILSKQIVEIIINQEDFQHPIVDCLSKDFMTFSDNICITRTRDEFLACRRQMTDRTPGLRDDVINCCVKANDKTGHAKVWLTLQSTGYSSKDFPSQTLRREKLALLSWRRSKANGWICRRCWGLMTGGPGA